MIVKIQVEVALASDAARLITDAVESAPEGFEIAATPLECDSEDGWPAGEEFTNHLLTVIYDSSIFFLVGILV